MKSTDCIYYRKWTACGKNTSRHIFFSFIYAVLFRIRFRVASSLFLELEITVDAVLRLPILEARTAYYKFFMWLTSRRSGMARACERGMQVRDRSHYFAEPVARPTMTPSISQNYTHTHTHVHVHARVQNTNTRVRKRPESTIFAAPTKSISCDRFMHLISLREIRLQRNGAAARTKRRIFGGRLNSLAWFLLLRVFEMTKFREWIAALFSDEESSNGADANRYFFALASD